jgi:hypothetical protein
MPGLRSSDRHALRFAKIRWTTLSDAENVGFQFLSLRQNSLPVLRFQEEEA